MKVQALIGMRSSAFISYSHSDRIWRERLETMLVPLVRGGLKIWSDNQIKPGDNWRQEIERALADAKVAVLLVSPAFLASEFIHNNELPSLLSAAKQEGLKVLWVPIEHSLYKFTQIADFQAVHDPAKPLAGLGGAKVNQALMKISVEIASALSSQSDSDGNN
jgi:hypothetical protein